MVGESRENDEQINRKKRSHHNNLPPCWKSGKIMHCGRSTHTTWLDGLPIFLTHGASLARFAR